MECMYFTKCKRYFSPLFSESNPFISKILTLYLKKR